MSNFAKSFVNGYSGSFGVKRNENIRAELKRKEVI